MFKNLNSAINWRINKLRQEKLKFYWKLRNILDFSKKEPINSFSIIVVGRNDNYGGDFTERLKTTLDWNLKLIPNSELIYIEWNNLPVRKSDCEWIVQEYKNAKCYIVPNELHKTISDNPKMPVMEYFGKNIGIRKASHDWILMLNADVLIGLDVAKNMKKLNPDFVYGTHYNNVKWEGQKITNHFMNDKNKLLNYFSANNKLEAVVGNFILTHKKNWLKATGYDENLTNVRAGVDSNGLKQLLYHGFKPMVLGNHYHLDHNESIMHGSNESHGSHDFNNIPYKNNNNWGFNNFNEKQISDRIWQIEKI